MNGLARQQITDFSNYDWTIPSANLSLENDEIHVWLVHLDHENLAEFEQLISADDRARANRFRFEKDRKRFIVGRGILRKIIGNYLQINPHQLQFFYNQFGKPFLPSNIKFNLSHSHDLAIYAFSFDREIGVDIEQNNSNFIEDGVISLCLTEIEKAQFYSFSQNPQIEFYFDCWTKKEAYLKANGCGLSVAPNEIETSQLSQTNFTFPKLPIIDGFSSALAIEENDSPIKLRLIAVNTR